MVGELWTLVMRVCTTVRMWWYAGGTLQDSYLQLQTETRRPLCGRDRDIFHVVVVTVCLSSVCTWTL